MRTLLLFSVLAGGLAGAYSGYHAYHLNDRTLPASAAPTNGGSPDSDIYPER
jgi:hypothetical protein